MFGFLRHRKKRKPEDTKENKEKGDTSIPTDTIPSAPADSIPANSTPGAPLQPELTPDGNTLIFRTKDKH